MAKDTAESSSNQLNLTVVALVALVAIVGLVALVMNAASVKTFATGSKLAQATTEENNLIGNAGRVNTVEGAPCWSGCSGRGITTAAGCQQACGCPAGRC